jgi:hypothetical protein
MFHDEADRIATPAASKTFIQFLGGRYREGGGLFIMKGAEAQVIRTPSFQFDEVAYHIDDVEAAEDLLYGILGDHCSHYPDCEYRSFTELKPVKITLLGEGGIIYRQYF